MLGKMYDPGKSYEEILDSKANKKDIAEWFKNDTSQWAFRKGLGSAAVKEIQYMTLPNGSVGFSNLLYIEPGDYFLKINFKKVNSIGAIKKLVCDMLDSQYSLQKRAKHSTYIKRDDGTIELKPYDKKIHPKEGQKYEIDYDRILKVGILKEEGKTNEEVAKILFPQAFEETEDDIANPESAIRMISNYYKTYQELVTGGYEKISST